ncbi:MAG: hypothetical protein UV69_C0041G0004 [Parcubacteria group bacterium GW2011_GWE2_43_12]|nr:MAG: hypothetical protein UV69_C0041G0004 [Parcubacteria group bacterium GW2011_GWE2_43_12]
MGQKRNSVAFDGQSKTARADTSLYFLLKTGVEILTTWASGGTGIRAGLKNLWAQALEGSIPSSPTKLLQE